MNSEQRKNTKNDFEKYFFKLMNDTIFEKNHGEYEKTEISRL